MTIISNHRFQANKMIRKSPTNSPKKVYQSKLSPTNKDFTTEPKYNDNILKIIRNNNPSNSFIPNAPPPSPNIVPVQNISELPELLFKRKITIYNEDYEVELPENFDIYEGLRIWYPSLYEAAMEEEYEIRLNQNNDKEEIDTEAAWDHYDYLEWIHD